MRRYLRVIKGLLLVLVVAVSWQTMPIIPSQAQACAETTGKVYDHELLSNLSKRRFTYTVYTPPCYQTEPALYPTLYLLHGSNATDSYYWAQLGLVDTLDTEIAAGRLPPMLVVMPFGGRTANENLFGKTDWGQMILTELLPTIETDYRASPTKAMRAIGGISRGGFWAMHLAFLYPDVFASVGGHSAFFDLGHLAAANPLFLAESAPDLDTLRIWLDHGPDDFAAANIGLLARRLSARGINPQYRVFRYGRHEPTYWAAHLRDYLAFYAETWPLPKTTGQTPALLLAKPAPNLPVVEIFLPCTAYKSLQSSISLAQLQAIAGGQADSQLVLTEQTFADLAALGLSLHPDTLRVAEADLLPTLEKNRKLWALRRFDQLSPPCRLLNIDEVQPLYGLAEGSLPGYPFAFAPLPKTEIATFMFSGVTAFVRQTAAVIARKGEAWAAGGMRGLTRRADVFHVSNEVSFYPSCPKFLGGVPPGPFCARESTFDILTALGTDVVELSGNHNLDYGADAYLATLNRYREAGIKTVGGGADLAEAEAALSWEINGNKVALISCNWAGPAFAIATAATPGAAPCDEDRLAAAVAALRPTHEIIIITTQYRETDSYVPGNAQKSQYRRLADLGADVVLGTQAHLPQVFEFYQPPSGQPAYLHYGLGNLYFDQTFFYMRSFLPELVLWRGNLLAVNLHVAIIDDLGRPRPMDDHNRTHFLSHMFVR
jgi:enterochelin esterase-like enzyme